MKFRYDIGFLRAVAVIAVVFFHFKLPYFAGGYIGVDIFFVISGYLMSSIIVGGLQKNKFSLMDFYKKRILRIVPALLFLLIGVCLAGSILLLPKDIELIYQQAVSSALFVSNIIYYLHSGYFDPDAQSIFLLHTWSLSVEWQFYLIYPLLLFPFRKQAKTHPGLLIGFTLLLIVLSFGTMGLYATKDNAFAFYMFPCRAWEMLLGGLAWLIRDRVQLRRRVRKPLTALSYIALIACIFMLDESNTPWPSGYTLIPTSLTALILALNTNFDFIRWTPVQFIGRISYSWYLWHWPLFVFSTYFAYQGIITTFLLLSSSLILACLSYYLIEQRRTIAKLEYIAPVGLACLLYFGFIAFFQQEQADRNEISYLSHYLSNYRITRLKAQFRKGKCHLDVDNKYEDFDQANCLSLSPDKRNILLIGDSHAGELASSFAEQLDDRQVNFMQATVSTTYPLLETKGPPNSVRLMNYLFNEFIPKNASKIDEVLIAAYWGSGQYDNYTLKRKIQDLTQYFKAQHLSYRIIGQTKSYTKNFPEILALEKKLGKQLENKYIDPKSAYINDFLQTFLTSKEYINVYDLKYQKYDGKDCYMHDDDHLSKFGANQLVKFLLTGKKI